MADTTIPNVTLEGVKIRFRNFAGAEGKFNRAGDRNFAIFLEPEVASRMIEEGWKVKQLKPRPDADPNDLPQDYIEVSVKYSSNGRPPKVKTITSAGKSDLNEDTIQILDWAVIENADVIIRAYQWEVNGNTGVKAYLVSLFVTLYEDELDIKYAGVKDSGQGPQADESDEVGVRFE